MFRLQETVQTTYSQLELCKALIQSWYDEYQAIPSKGSVGVILAQNMIETGGKYFWNNNWGNVKVGNDIPGQTIDYMMLKNVWEIESGVKKMYQPPARETWFRSFPTLTDGVKFQFDLLKNSRYKASWSAIEKGDVALFAHDLKIAGYYTAPEQDYINGMMAHYNLYNKSGNYEAAVASFNTPAPPLQPFTTIPDSPAEQGILTEITNGIDDAKDVPEQDIEEKGTSLATKLQGLLGTVSQWLKPKS